MGSLPANEMASLNEEYRELMMRKAENSMNKALPLKMESDELDRLEAIFHQVDRNGDGVVDFTEFKAVMGILGQQVGRNYNFLQLKALFRLADLDGSGSIDFNEYLHAQRRLAKSFGTGTSASLIASFSNRNKESIPSADE